MVTDAKKERGGLIWKRPSDGTANFPRTWHTFKARNISGVEVEFVIKDIPADKYDESVNFVALYALKFKPVYKALGMLYEIFH